MKTTAGLLSILLLLVFAPATAQEEPWSLVLSTNDTLDHCRLIGLQDSVLVVSRPSIDSVMVGTIRVVFRRTESSFWRTAGTASLVGGVAGALIGAVTYSKSEESFLEGPTPRILGMGVGGAIGGFLVGGVIGATSGGPEVHDLSNLPTPAKVMHLRRLIEKAGS